MKCKFFLLYIVLILNLLVQPTQAQDTDAPPIFLTPIAARPSGAWVATKGNTTSISLYTIDGQFVAIVTVSGALAWDSEGRLVSGDSVKFVEIQTGARSKHWYKIIETEVLDNGLVSITAEDGLYSLLPLATSKEPTSRPIQDATIDEKGNWKGQASFFITGFGAGSFAAYIYADVRNYNVSSLSLSASTDQASSEPEPTSEAVVNAEVTETLDCEPHSTPKTTAKLVWTDGNPVTIGNKTPFFIPAYTAEGKSSGGMQTNIKSVRFDISGTKLNALNIGAQKSQSGTNTHVLYILLSQLRDKDIEYFDIDENGVLFPSNINCIDEDGPFITVLLYSQARPKNDRLLKGWKVSATQKGETLTVVESTEEDSQGFYSISRVASDPIIIQAVDPTTSDTYEFTLFPSVRSADAETSQHALWYLVGDVTAKENKVSK